MPDSVVSASDQLPSDREAADSSARLWLGTAGGCTYRVDPLHPLGGPPRPASNGAVVGLSNRAPPESHRLRQKGPNARF